MTAPTRRNILRGEIAASAPTVGAVFQASRSAERQTRGRGQLKTVPYRGVTETAVHFVGREYLPLRSLW